MSKAIWSTSQGIDALNSAARQGFEIAIHEDRPAELFALLKPKEKLTIDFRTSIFKNRLKTSGKNQPLTKALGLAKGSVDVADLSAGLGGDAFVLAHVGANVVAYERNPILYCMLVEALEYAKTDEAVGVAAQRLNVAHGDARELLTEARVVYFDPMYPEMDSSALPKKEMQILNALIGEDRDQKEVLKFALDKASDRVVVKRPRRAPPLIENPTQSFDTPTTRYDMYLIDTNKRL